ncbi:MAG TPA: peptidylprolyl isomerase [Flavitalea sp.]|nr:peptidylprolyl isomerase [Flavitalea sp.]
MSIIQTIRDKAAWIIIGAIALALIAFIVQDGIRNRSIFSDNPTALGSIDGTKIDAVAFETRYKQIEDQYQNQGYQINDQMREGIREQIWNEYVDDAILSEKYKELGIQVSDKELSDILYGVNPPQDLRQQFTDEATGQYNPTAAYQQIQALRKKKNSAAYNSFFGQYLPSLVKNRQREKYISLLGNSVYVPRWMVEKMNADNSQQASISYVNIPYSSISDSLVKVTDEDIKTYTSARKEGFQMEEARGMEYVTFDASPTKTDSQSVYDQVNAVRQELQTTTDYSGFFARNPSELPFFDGFVLKSKMKLAATDSIQSLQDGDLLGPFVDGANYTLAKMIAHRSMPDSVKVRHILIKTADQGRPVLEDSVAKKRIDSIVNAINKGSSFDSMVIKLSDDPGSKDKKGEYDFGSMQLSTISKEFAEAIFYGKTGDKKVVRVENAQYAGYHYLEVLNQKNFEPAYKVAYYSKPIVPSDQTTTSAMGLAAQFAAENRNKKSFDDNAKKKNLNIFNAADIRPLASNIVGLGQSRELVKWMYEAKVGDVSDKPFVVGDKYVVPVLTNSYKAGLMPVEIARAQVEPLIRNQKKANQIIEKLKGATTLDMVAKVTGQPVQRIDTIQFSSPFIPNVGQEFRVIGAAFNKANQTSLSTPIAGNGAVFVIKTENIRAVPNVNFDVNVARLQTLQQQQGALANPQMIMAILKKSSTIKDNRHRFF